MAFDNDMLWMSLPHLSKPHHKYRLARVVLIPHGDIKREAHGCILLGLKSMLAESCRTRVAFSRLEHA
jgi:hypothetical protein